MHETSSTSQRLPTLTTAKSYSDVPLPMPIAMVKVTNAVA